MYTSVKDCHELTRAEIVVRKAKNVSRKTVKLQIFFPIEPHIFMIIDGATEKVFQIIMPLKSTYNKKSWFCRTKMAFLNTTARF